MTNLMDDLAKEIHNYLLEISTEFEGKHLVLIPITEVVKKFGRNHRTIQRRIHALKDEGLLDHPNNLCTGGCIQGHKPGP